MAVVEELLRSEADGRISFGNHTLQNKKKVEDFEHGGDLWKVKTCREITKLEKNGMFLYESVPGTSVTGFSEKADGVEFTAEGAESAQVTVGLKEDAEYAVYIQGSLAGTMRTGMSGKLNFSLELENAGETSVRITEV